MVEKIQDVVAAPGQFQISYNLANIYFELKLYKQAAIYYERALKVIDRQPNCLEKLIDCYMCLNINDKKVLEMIAYLQKRQYNKKLEDKRQTVSKKIKPQ